MALPVPVFRGKVEGGRLLLHEQTAFVEYRNGFEGHEVEVIVRRYHKRRSVRQNRYYWRVVLPLLAEHCGYRGTRGRRDMHGILKRHFGVSSTATLNTEEFHEYVEECCQLAAEMRVIIPPPGKAE